jgi:hypothetical protein
MKPGAQRWTLPQGLQLKDTSFYSSAGQVSGVTSGVRSGYEYVVFEYDTSGEMSRIYRVVAIRMQSPKEPRTHLSRASGLTLERIGEWVFGSELRPLIGSAKTEELVGELLSLLEYAKDFPQNI